MKRQIMVVVGVVLLHGFLTATMSGASFAGTNPSPKELETYYPPIADGPVYLFRMLGLERAFSGIAAELTENDLEGARELYKVFVDEYRSVKGMVVEWNDAFPEAEVENLGLALHGPDPGAAFAALNSVGEVCHQCHVTTMVVTQQKYRWGDFSALVVDDGEGGQKKAYGVFKKFIAANMAGVDVDAGQGQWENARKHFTALKERSSALTRTCRACHKENPTLFTDPATLGLLENELNKALPDRWRVSDLLKTFGGQTCAGCHLIHVPAAMRAAVVP